jgi:hypothetical protein
VGKSEWRWQWTVNGQHVKGGARYRTAVPLSAKTSFYTVVVSVTCSFHEHWNCFKLQTYYSTAVNTKLLDMPDHEVNIIDATDGYSSFLSVSVWISVACRFFVPWEWWGVRKDQGIWNSFTTFPNLTDPILRTDRILLAVIVECWNVWINWYPLFNLSDCRYIHGGTGWRSWLSHYALGWIPVGVIGIIRWLNPSCRTMTLGSTNPLTERSTRNISWG